MEQMGKAGETRIREVLLQACESPLPSTTRPGVPCEALSASAAVRMSLRCPDESRGKTGTRMSSYRDFGKKWSEFIGLMIHYELVRLRRASLRNERQRRRLGVKARSKKRPCTTRRTRTPRPTRRNSKRRPYARWAQIPVMTSRPECAKGPAGWIAPPDRCLYRTR